MLRSRAGSSLGVVARDNVAERVVAHDDVQQRVLTKTNATTEVNTDSALSPPRPKERTNWIEETLSGCRSRCLVLENSIPSRKPQHEPVYGSKVIGLSRSTNSADE